MPKPFTDCSPFPSDRERHIPPFRCWMCRGTTYASETIAQRDGERTIVRGCAFCEAQCRLTADGKWVRDE